MNQRRNASRVEPSAVGFSEDVSLSAVRIFDHLTPRMKLRGSRSSFTISIAGPRGRLCTFAKMPRLEPSRLRISRTCTIYRTEVKAKYSCCCSVCQSF